MHLEGERYEKGWGEEVRRKGMVRNVTRRQVMGGKAQGNGTVRKALCSPISMTFPQTYLLQSKRTLNPILAHKCLLFSVEENVPFCAFSGAFKQAHFRLP